MKRLKKCLLPLFTLLLVAVGAAMPFAASYFQDARQTDPEIRSFDSFRLTLRQETDLGRTLGLVAGSDYYIAEDEESEEARMTQADVLAAGEELMKELIQFGLLDAAAPSLPTIWPQILHANDESVSIPAWTLDWDIPNEVNSLYVWMDDAAGKAFLISLPSLQYSKEYASNTDREAFYAQAENWRAFLAEYYGTEVHIAGEEWFDGSVRFALTFSLGAEEDGEQMNFQLDLYIYYWDGFTTLSPYVSPVNASGNQAALPPYDS